MNDFKSSGLTGNISISKSFGSFRNQLLKFVTNLPTLPNVFVEYTFSQAKFSVDIDGKSVILKFPKVNEMLTEYCRECLPVYSTLAFFEVFNEQFPITFAPTFTNEKLESALSLYQKLYNKADAKEVKDTLSYYLSNRLNLIGMLDFRSLKSRLDDLKSSLKAVEERYNQRLFNEVLPNTATYDNGKSLEPNIIRWFNEKKANKVLNDESIRYFIQRANFEMAADIKIEFAKNQLRAIMFYADPVISDPRFRMSLEDARWNEYDETIKKEVAFYNQKFAGVADYQPLDWRFVKAMVWTEVMAGPNEKRGEWQKRPMQIGVPGDPGFLVLKKAGEKDGENTELIITPEFKAKLNQTVQWDGETNIKAGIAWLFRKAVGDQIMIDDNKVDDPQVLTDTVKEREMGFEVIAKRLKITTTKNLILNNPNLNSGNIKVGQSVKYQKAHSEKYISRWLDWKTAIKNYNSKEGSGVGDSAYLPKVERAYQIIISRDK